MPPGKYRPERGGLVELHTTVHPETRAELERIALGRFGTPRALGRLIDEDYMVSRPYEPTNEQRKDRTCIAAYAARATEEEAIERLFVDHGRLIRALELIASQEIPEPYRASGQSGYDAEVFNADFARAVLDGAWHGEVA